jgi:hypothetical protein
MNIFNHNGSNDSIRKVLVNPRERLVGHLSTQPLGGACAAAPRRCRLDIADLICRWKLSSSRRLFKWTILKTLSSRRGR